MPVSNDTHSPVQDQKLRWRPAGPTTSFTGTFNNSVGALLTSTNVSNGGTVAIAVGCYSQASAMGNVEYVQLTFLQLSSDGSSYSTATSGPSPSLSASSTPSGTSTATDPPAHALAAATATPTATPTSSPTPTSTLPSGGAQTGAGGAALPGGSNNLLIALGAVALAGSAAAIGVAIRRPRTSPQENGQGHDTPPGAN